MLVFRTLVMAGMLVVSIGATAQALNRNDPNLQGTVQTSPKNMPSGSLIQPSNQGNTVRCPSAGSIGTQGDRQIVHDGNCGTRDIGPRTPITREVCCR
jgi:hypothetical protein